MPSLADQVREMMRILEIVDPQAAYRIKSGLLAGMNAPAAAPASDQLTMSTPPTEAVPASIVQPTVAPSPAATVVVPSHSSELAHEITAASFSADNLAQGIVWAEILGPPLARRQHPHR